MKVTLPVLLLLLSCKPMPKDGEASIVQDTRAGEHQNAVGYKQFQSPVPKVTEAMHYADFWVARAENPSALLASLNEIERFNQKNLEKAEPIVDLWSYPEAFTGAEVSALIQKVSKLPASAKYVKGVLVGADYFSKLRENLNLAGLPPQVSPRYGIAVRRSLMKNFPTDDEIYNSAGEYALDRFMETTAYPLEPLVILAESSDGGWLFAQMYNYLAWIKAEDVALTDKKTLFEYVATPQFLVVTGKRATTNFNPLVPGISEVALPMGVRVPLARAEEVLDQIDGQSPHGNFVVKMPVRGNDGQLELKLSLISRSEDVNVGYLPFTRENILRQSFKLLGSRYGWGGRFNGNDCSSLIMDTYRVFGFRLPRNSGEIALQTVGKNFEMPAGMTLTERMGIMEQAQIGAALEMPGHIMLYIGKYEGEHYVIHAHTGFSVSTAAGRKKYIAQQVAVTPLSIQLDSGKQYLEGVRIVRGFDPVP